MSSRLELAQHARYNQMLYLMQTLLHQVTELKCEVKSLKQDKADEEKKLNDLHMLFFAEPKKKDKPDLKAMFRADLYAPKKLKCEK